MNNQDLIEIKVLFAEAAKSFDTMNRKVEDFEDRLDKASKQSKELNDETDKSASAFDKAGEVMAKMGGKLETLGNKLLYFGASWSAGVSIPLIQFGRSAVDTFFDVEEAWVSMSKVLDRDVDTLKTQFGDLATLISEKYGLAQAQAITTINEFIKVGIEEEAVLSKLSNTAAQTAILFDTDLANSTEIVRELMLQWGWTAEDVSIGLAAINEQADKTATSELGLAEAFTKASPAARQAGIDFRDLGGYIAALQGRGYEAAEAGNSLRTILQYLTIDTGKLSETLSVLGINMSEAELNSLNGADKIELLASAYGKFRDEAGMTSSEIKSWADQMDENGDVLDTHNAKMNDLSSAMSDLVRKRQFPKIIALLDDMANGLDTNSETVSEYEKAIKAVNLTNEELVAIWEGKYTKVLDETPAKWDILNAKIANAKAKIGDIIVDALIPLVDKFLKLVDGFNNLDPSLQRFIVQVGLVAAALGPVLIAVAAFVKSMGLILSVVGPVITAIGGLIGAIGLGPFLLLLAAIPIAIYAIVEAFQFFKAHFLDKLDPKIFTGMFNAVKEFFGGIAEGLGGGIDFAPLTFAFEVLGDMLEWVAEQLNKVNWEKVGAFAKEVGKYVGIFIKVAVVIGAVLFLLANWPIVLTILIAWMATHWDKVKEWANGIIDAVEEWINSTWESITGWISEVWDSFTGFFEGIASDFASFFNGILTSIITFGQSVLSAFTTVFAPVIDLVSAIAGLLFSILQLAFYAILLVIQTVWDAVKAATETVWGFISTTISSIVDGITNFVTTKFSAIRDFITGIWTAILLVATEKWNYLKDTIISPVVEWIQNNIINRFNAAKDGVINAVTNLVNTGIQKFLDFKTGLSNKLDEIKTTIKEKWDSAIQVIKDTIGSAYQWGVDMMTNFINGITAKIGELKNKIDEVANSIKSKLHFSVPDEGPLADADTYMPDFIDLMVGGLDKNKGRLFDMVDQVAAGMAMAFNPAQANLALEGGLGAVINPVLDRAALQNQLNGTAVVPVQAASPSTNIMQVHKHYEVKPGVMIASDAEQREFVRHIQKLEEIENIRTQK